MSHQHLHLSDSELLLAADGELPRRRAAEVSEHLSSCWSCRERMHSIEGAITDFVRAYNGASEGQIPPAAGPRAMLRARMAEDSRVAPVATRRLGLMWRAGTLAACLSALAVTFLVFEFKVNAGSPRPNVRVTPGETRPISLGEVCRNSQADVVVDNIPVETKQKVLAAYGIPRGRPEDFEIDFLITPDLGGTDSVRNLWPEPHSARWNAAMKDRLEQRLHDLVCAGKMSLSTAQNTLAADWIGAYKEYVDSRSR